MVFRSVLGGSVGGAAIAIAVVGGVSGCGTKASTDPEPTCLAQAANAACTDPQYAPTFQNLFDNTLLKTCSNGGGPNAGCHSAPNPEAGFELDQIDLAYTNLLATNAEGERRVIPGDVQCGKVIVRLETPGKSWSMPPNLPLDEQQLCAIRQWIKMGALRQ